MSEPSLNDQLKSMIVERLFLKMEPAEIGDEDELMDTLGVDSVQIFEIVIGLEEEFGVVFEEDEFDIETFKSVKSMVEAIQEKM